MRLLTEIVGWLWLLPIVAVFFCIGWLGAGFVHSVSSPAEPPTRRDGEQGAGASPSPKSLGGRV